MNRDQGGDPQIIGDFDDLRSRADLTPDKKIYSPEEREAGLAELEREENDGLWMEIHKGMEYQDVPTGNTGKVLLPLDLNPMTFDSNGGVIARVDADRHYSISATTEARTALLERAGYTRESVSVLFSSSTKPTGEADARRFGFLMDIGAADYAREELKREFGKGGD